MTPAGGATQNPASVGRPSWENKPPRMQGRSPEAAEVSQQGETSEVQPRFVHHSSSICGSRMWPGLQPHSAPAGPHPGEALHLPAVWARLQWQLLPQQAQVHPRRGEAYECGEYGHAFRALSGFFLGTSGFTWGRRLSTSPTAGTEVASVSQRSSGASATWSRP